jgi:hypothetical protein
MFSPFDFPGDCQGSCNILFNLSKLIKAVLPDKILISTSFKASFYILKINFFNIFLNKKYFKNKCYISKKEH